MTQDLDGARERVFAAINAQSVYKHLSLLENDRDRYVDRWIWELLQNARDAAPAEGITAEIILGTDDLLFRHNGVPFKTDDIAHLIYH